MYICEYFPIKESEGKERRRTQISSCSDCFAERGDERRETVRKRIRGKQSIAHCIAILHSGSHVIREPGKKERRDNQRDK